MKRKLFLTAAAVLCLLNLTACGGRQNEPGAKYPATTPVPAVRATTARTQTRIGEDFSEMASDAVQGASEMASNAAAKGKELATDAASDVSDAVNRRRGEGDYNAGDNGKVQENTVNVTTVR